MDWCSLYVIVSSDGMGNSTFSDDEPHWLKQIKKALIEKYGETNFRVKFLAQCIIKSETHEFDVQDREWVRYILHAEYEPEDDHHNLLKELEEKMNEHSHRSQQA